MDCKLLILQPPKAGGGSIASLATPFFSYTYANLVLEVCLCGVQTLLTAGTPGSPRLPKLHWLCLRADVGVPGGFASGARSDGNYSQAFLAVIDGPVVRFIVLRSYIESGEAIREGGIFSPGNDADPRSESLTGQ